MSLFDFDLKVFHAIHIGMHSSWLDPVFLLLSYSGLGQVQAVGILLLAFWRERRWLVLPLLISEGVAGILISPMLKGFVARERPSNLVWAHAQEQFFSGSFPSGHTITSFAIATAVFLLSYPTSKRWVGWCAVGWAVLVGLSRIYRGVHWPTDVIGSACGGIFAACVMVLLLGLYKRLSGAVSPARL